MKVSDLLASNVYIEHIWIEIYEVVNHEPFRTNELFKGNIEDYKKASKTINELSDREIDYWSIKLTWNMSIGFSIKVL